MGNETIAQAQGEAATATAARFIAGLDLAGIPPDVAEKARTCVLYGFGIGLLCLSQETAATAARGAVLIDGDASGRGPTLLVDGQRSSVSAAAFANAVLLHSRCQEDTSGTAHLGVVVLGVGLAMLEAGLARPGDFLPAVVAGYEVGGALESAFGRDTMRAGHRASAIYGTFAAAATAARLLRLPAERVDAALANAAQFTGGTLQSIPEGSDEWRYQVGAAARHGLLAAVLAQEGSVCAHRALEGPQGFALAFARRELMQGDLDFSAQRRWMLPQVTFKPYPVCAHNQTVALLGAQIHAKVRPEQIAHVRLRISTYLVPGLLARGPFTRVADTLMSTAFCCACASVNGTVSMQGLSGFEDAAVLAMLERTVVEPDAAMEYPAAVAELTLRDGSKVELSELRRFGDFSLGRDDVMAQLLRLGQEESVPAGAFAALARFAFPADGEAADPALVTGAFADARAARVQEPRRLRA